MSVQALSRFFQLGLDEWYPEQLPAPSTDTLSIDGTGMKLQEIISEVACTTYDIHRDDAVLREDPGNFEHLRAGYPVRREPGAYKIRLINDEPGAGTVLEKLGFQVLADQCM
jgi:erythronate-4-phosphate dehydrogenase